MSKVDRIIKQIEEGTYKVSSEEIARKLMKKNPTLNTEIERKGPTVMGEINKRLDLAQALEEDFTHVFQHDFFYNGVPYGSYLIGLEADGSTTVVDFIGDNWRDFEDENPDMENRYDQSLDERIIELGLE